VTHSDTAVQLPKYQQVLESVKNDVLCGRYQPGQKLPSEAALVPGSHVEKSGASVARLIAGGNFGSSLRLKLELPDQPPSKITASGRLAK
jgi:hypothetical protein